MVGVMIGKRSECWWWRYLKWFHEARVGSYATRFADTGQIQPAHFFHPNYSLSPCREVPEDRHRFGIDSESDHIGLT